MLNFVESRGLLMTEWRILHQSYSIFFGKKPFLRRVESIMFVITPCSDITVANSNRLRFSHKTGIISVFASIEGLALTKDWAISSGNDENP
jgi:hypothetical protein